MPITDNIGGVLHTLDTIHDNDGGVLHELATVHSNDDGVLHEIHSAWKPPDNLIWTVSEFESGTIYTGNNGYTFTKTGDVSYRTYQSVSGKFRKNSKITFKHYDYISGQRFIQYVNLDNTGDISIGAETASVDIQEGGEHSIGIWTCGNGVTLYVTVEKI